MFFVLEVPKPRKLMEKVSFYQKHHFTDLLVFLHVLRSKSIFFLLFFCLFILAHLEKPKKSRHTFWWKSNFFHEFLCSKTTYHPSRFEEKCCYRKGCLQVIIFLEDKVFPQIRNTILARKLSCVEGCNTCFNEAQPSSHFSGMTMIDHGFLFFDEVEVTE